MNIMTRDTDYAVRSLAYMACGRRGEIFTVPRLVRALGVPRPFLRKILQRLNREGIVRSSKGRGGGFTLAAAPERIKVADLIGIFQGELAMSHCVLRKRPCPNRAACILRKKLKDVEQSVRSELRSITIASLLARKG